MDQHTCIPMSEEVALHIAGLITVDHIDNDAEVIILKVPNHLEPQVLDAIATHVCILTERSIIIARDGYELESLTAEDMLAAGWVRAEEGC